MCGNKGRYQTEDLTDADAPVRSTPWEDGYDPGNGTVLTKHKGKLMCPVCINEAKANSEGLQDAKKHNAAEKFRDKAGFVNTVEE